MTAKNESGQVSPRVVLFVQARMGSKRLPGKHMRLVNGRPLISFLIERLRRCQAIDEIVVATTENSLDNQLFQWCEQNDVTIFRGEEEDVLARFVKAARYHHAGVVVRICGDCTLIDPAIVDQVTQYFLEAYPNYDYVSNVHPRTYPRGMDVEVMANPALEMVHRDATTSSEKEHVTPYIYQNPELFRLGNVAYETDLSCHRWTVDTDEDLLLITQILKELYPLKPDFTMEDVLQVLENHPEWSKINAHIVQREI